MRIRSLSFDRLTDQQLAAWESLRSRDAALDSPFFHPDFTRAVAEVRSDLEIGTVETDGRPVGFLPFHRQRGDVGRPVGLHLSDFHGAVVPPGSKLDAVHLIQECGLKAFHFNHMLASQTLFGPFHWRAEPSPWMNVSSGFEHYAATRTNLHSDELKQIARQVRRIGREVGPIRLEPYCTDRDMLRTLLHWKMEQYRKLKTVNCLEPVWVQSLLHALVDRRDDALRGMLSVLHVGDLVAAIHLGLRSHGVLHSWIPAYNVALAKYSPGTMLLTELARAAPSLGIARIDLGRGPEVYKQRLMSGVTMVNEGSVELRLLAGAFHRGVRSTRELVRASSLGTPAQFLVRSGRRWLIARQWRKRTGL